MLDFVEKLKISDSTILTQTDTNGATRETLEEAVNGDRRAFKQLINHYYVDIFRFSFHLTKDKTQAEDLTHDVCLKIAGSIHQFKFGSQFKSWVYRIVINTYKDNVKKQANLKKRETQYHEQTVLGQHQPRPEDSIQFNDLLNAIDKLPEKLKITLILVHAQELTHSLAAQVLGCTRNTVSWRIHEAKKQLKKIIREQS